jgi:DnaJ-class molecular chaperone
MAHLRESYEALGLEGPADAATVRRAFFAAARRWHPDKQDPASTPADLQAAKERFLAAHKAYEAIVDSGDARVEDPAVMAPFTNAFDGSVERFERAKAAFQEADEYVSTLYSDAVRKGEEGHRWTAEEEEQLLRVHGQACLAREMLRQEMISAEVYAGYQKVIEAKAAKATATQNVVPPEKTPEIDGPRTMTEMTESVANVATEIFEDLTGYFSTWNFFRSEVLAS